MSKPHERLSARNQRQLGKSIVEIANNLHVSKSTVSLWTRDINLSTELTNKLKNNSLKGAEKGRILGSIVQKTRRIEKIKQFNNLGVTEFENLTPKEILMIGTALYWAEGSKKQRKVELCNSDPKMIKFYINWLKQAHDIPVNQLSCYVGINEAHRFRELEVKNFWSKNTGIPLNQFTKTSFKHYPLKKTYENFYSHYGTLSVKVKQPARIFYKILGQIHGLSMAT